MKAEDIIDLLAARHSRDLFFSEVKDGPTWGTTHLRLDALAIAKSWSPVRLSAYEVKVSRSDWLGDRKWESYRDLAHTLTIAAPRGVVEISELPDGIGLLEVSSTGKSLRCVRKAAYRDVPLPGELLLYLLMSRTIPGDPRAARERTREERIAEWKQRMVDSKEVGYWVHEKTRERIRRLEDAARREPELAALDAWLHAHGARPWGRLVERVDGVVKSRETEICEATTELRRVAVRASRLLSRDALAKAKATP